MPLKLNNKSKVGNLVCSKETTIGFFAVREAVGKIHNSEYTDYSGFMIALRLLNPGNKQTWTRNSILK